MITPRALIILGLALCATAGAVTPALAVPTSVTSTAPKLNVTGHVSWHWLNPYSPMPYTTLRLTGSHFLPGATVRIAVLNTARWEVIGKGSTHAQPARTMVLCGHDFRTCYRPNARAGTIDYRLRLSSAPPASNLQVLYRSGTDGGMQGVTLQ